ncbi:MAG TPA: alpha/beta fold hydrolase [Opitutaceae bacterium]|nr:alpha/beta fold hydrolase [Opitutaceae bacterium]
MQLFHRDLGGAGNPPLVILHGMLGSSRNWQSAGADLAARYHVLALDLRNHGRSPHADPMTYDALMGDVLDWLDGHRLGQVTLLGHSMGGKTAMLLACRHPARVARLFVVDIAPKDYHWVAHRSNFTAMNELNLDDLRSRAEAELRFEARVPNWGTRKFLTTNLERGEDGRWRWQINLPAITAALPALEANSLLPADQFQGAVRFITGARSDYVEPADHAAIREHFPRAEIVAIPDSGHNPHMDARPAFVAAVLGAA